MGFSYFCVIFVMKHPSECIKIFTAYCSIYFQRKWIVFMKISWCNASLGYFCCPQQTVCGLTKVHQSSQFGPCILFFWTFQVWRRKLSNRFPKYVLFHIYWDLLSIYTILYKYVDDKSLIPLGLHCGFIKMEKLIKMWRKKWGNLN